MSDRTPFSPENMRKRFHELGRKREAILAKTGPLRAERDRIIAEADAKAKGLADAFKKIEKDEGLFEIDMERGMIAKALGGKTGKPE